MRRACRRRSIAIESMFSERTRLRLQDIVENADRIASYVEDLNLEGLRANAMALDAIERCLSRISEAIVHIGEQATADAELGVSWVEVRALGNRLRHEYRRIDARLIFETAIGDIPAVRDAAVRALSR